MCRGCWWSCFWHCRLKATGKLDRLFNEWVYPSLPSLPNGLALSVMTKCCALEWEVLFQFLFLVSHRPQIAAITHFLDCQRRSLYYLGCWLHFTLPLAWVASSRGKLSNHMDAECDLRKFGDAAIGQLLCCKSLQGGPSRLGPGLGWLWFWLFHCWANSAWADVRWAEWAEQLSKMSGTSKSKSTQPRS